MRIQRLTTIPDFPLPVRSTALAGAWDLHAAIPHTITLAPGEQAMIGTGYAWEIPPGKVGLLLPRSGKGAREGAVLGNLVGLIDADYRGEVTACIWNRNPPAVIERFGIVVPNSQPLTIQPGERFCQLLIVQSYIDELELVEKLSATARGAGGFGHTGS